MSYSDQAIIENQNEEIADLNRLLFKAQETEDDLRTQLSQREAAVREFVDFLMVVQLRFDLGETGEQADELIAKHSNQSAEGR